MKHAWLAVCSVVLAPAVASAEPSGFVQGVVGYSSPVTGEQYMEGVSSGAPRVGIRGGYTPLRAGNAYFGFDATLDWRPLAIQYGDTAQELRAMAGPRLAFIDDHYMTFFRLAVGYDRLYLGDSVNETGFAVEPGFGGALRRGSLLFGAEIAVPVVVHLEHRDDEYMDGFAGADLQVMFSVGSTL